MCERTCPICGSDKHFEGFGMAGAYLACMGCGTTLAWRADPEAARIDLTEDEAKAWALQNRGVLPGAEARDPKDDELWTAPPPTSEPSVLAGDSPTEGLGDNHE